MQQRAYFLPFAAFLIGCFFAVCADEDVFSHLSPSID